MGSYRHNKHRRFPLLCHLQGRLQRIHDSLLHEKEVKVEVPALIRLYHALLLHETGFYMLTLRSDNGKGEYVNRENAEWLAQHGIRHETSAPHTPEQNGSAERLNRTLKNQFDV